ncbi:ABC transporter ATP-binding protein [Pseudomonas marginalis]|uniref:Glutathione import ATP-binding protein GsiA n=1 Tax=Pseudomonas marginalis TaxID=298 RepID=A0A9X9BUW4_PSEMA|nr:ABC transporter ATP-binding protein [Pseudomonas marginalis]TWR60378.1 ABC transporter ATP-binding protein [Pseudomonas marginalis]SEB41838.1 peptide/nickel transport system ATP-binding protein [Pseudomonas marginalis]
MSLLQIKNLEVRFAASGTGVFGLNKQWVKAVNGVSLDLAAGETLGLVGESGSGKSTLGRAILHLNPISAGQVLFDGIDMAHGSAIDIVRLRQETAMIFQDPYAALNPRHTIGETIAEVLRVQRKVPAERIPARVNELLDLVGLRPELASRKPGALSGGQCQRVGIARALAVEPRLIIADECVAALDVSIQGQIINLLLELQQRMNLAILFIAHDLAIVRRLCDRVAVMYLGKIVEEGPVEAVFTSPRHPYTAALIEAIPEIDPHRPLPTQPLPGEPPSPLNLPTGCAFHPRCRYARTMCSVVLPPTHSLHEHRYSCVLEEPLTLPAHHEQGVMTCNRAT